MRLSLLRVATVVGSTVLAAALHAQCPNGTPPPCAGTRATGTTPAPNSVAVLYFDARDTADVSLAEGLSDEIATGLGHVTRLAVKIPSAVRRIQVANTGNVRAIGRALGVKWVVDGSVRRSGGQLRVSVRLIDAETETTRWTSGFTPGTATLLTMQLDIAREVTTGIVGTLTPVERAIVAALPTANAAAYEHYLMGNAYLGRRGQWLARAVEEYRAAIKLDPAFDAPRAGMALADASSRDDGKTSPLGLKPPALLALIDSVIQRSPSVAMAWMARGVVIRQAGRLDDARPSLERAVALEPNSVEAHYRMAQALVLAAQFAEARVSLQRALMLDPVRAVTYELLGVVSYFERRLPEATRMLDSALTLDPAYGLAMRWRVVVLTAAGDTSGTRKMIEALFRLYTPGPYERTQLPNARTLLDSITIVDMVLHSHPQALALVQRFDDALSQLGTPAPFRPDNKTACRVLVADPAFDPVRRDPRFVQFETACLALKEGG